MMPRVILFASIAIGVLSLIPWLVQAFGISFLGLQLSWAAYTAIFGIGLLCGAFVLAVVSDISDFWPPDASGSVPSVIFFVLAIFALIIFCVFAIFVGVGAQTGQSKLTAAAIAILSGGVALVLLVAALRIIDTAIRLFARGERIEVQSQWGGLGGGLGGWQLSRLASLVLLAALLIVASLGALGLLRGMIGTPEPQAAAAVAATGDANKTPGK
jgi:hypothetical protein